MPKILPILYHYFHARGRMGFSPEELLRWQAQKRGKIETFAQKRSPFYRQHFGEVVTKKEMMANFSQFNTREIDREEALALAVGGEERRDFSSDLQGVTVGLSSGTSGNRGLFIASEREKAFWCGNILAKVFPHPPWKKQKIAFFLRANSRLYETISSRTLTFRYFDLLEDVERLRNGVKEFAPDILVGPPSMLLLLIGSCFPQTVISVAETLFPSDEARLEKGFSQKIGQVYQATEGFLGYTCQMGTLHLNEDLLVFEKEWFDEYRFMPILTDLFRKTQPIIRYRLDDILVIKNSRCACGCVFQPLERIEGRRDDLLYVASESGKMIPLFPDFVSRAILAASPTIQEFGVEQTSIDHWMIYIDSSQRIEVAAALTQLIKRIEGHPPKFHFIDCPFPRARGAKLRRIRRSYENLSSL